MKVLMITPYYYPVVGGTETIIGNISTTLNEMGVPTDIMTFNMHKPLALCEKINGVNVKKIPSIYTKISKKILDKISRTNFIPLRNFTSMYKNYDVLHFHNDVDLTFPAFSWLKQKPKIFHCHCLDTTYAYYKQNQISRYILKNIADVYIALSNYLAESLVNLGIPRNKIEVVPNGIDVKRFQPNRESKIENLLLFVGRLAPKKGLLTLLKSLNYLETSIQLVIVGPPSYDPKYSEQVLRLAKKVNDKTNHVVKYLGVQPSEEILKWYQKASMFVCPSLSESFPVVNMEALSCETPVVASNVGAIPEVVRDGENGIIVPPSNSLKLADAIQYMVDNKDVRTNMGIEGRKWVVKTFSSEVIAKRLCGIYQNMLNRYL